MGVMRTDVFSEYRLVVVWRLEVEDTEAVGSLFQQSKEGCW